MMKNLIKGENLNEKQRAEVLRAFIYRGLNPQFKSDDEFIRTHAFYFIKDGSRLAVKPNYCEPVYMAD